MGIADGTVPPPSIDLIIARAKICPYCDSSENLITPRMESALPHMVH